MNRKIFILTLLFVVAGCGSDDVIAPDDYLIEFQISMDRIEAPAQVLENEPLTIRLYGIIGPDTRFSFDYADTVATLSRFELSLFGIQNTDPNHAQIPVLIEWRGVEFTKAPPHEDAVHVVLNQADGSILEATTRVISQ